MNIKLNKKEGVCGEREGEEDVAQHHSFPGAASSGYDTLATTKSLYYLSRIQGPAQQDNEGLRKQGADGIIHGMEFMVYQE